MLNQNNAGTSVFLDKWNGTAYANSLDVSSVLLGVEWGYESWGQEGLRRISGSLSLGGFPRTALSESLDPRANPGRFQRGNRVRVLYAGELAATLYITGFPLPAHPGKPEFDVELGCVLSLLSYRQPPSDAEEESETEDYSEERTAQSVILSYLNYAGLTDITTTEGTCPGSLFVQQKDGLGSWVEECGKIAFANGAYLWQKPNGVVAISTVNIAPASPDATIQVGGWEGEEIEFEPVQAGETPVERVICTGEEIKFDDNGGVFSDISTEYGFGSMVSPYGPEGRIPVAREIITETAIGAVRERNTYRYECFCTVNPFYPSNLGLTLSMITFEEWNYEGDTSGRLLRYSKEVRQPIVAVAQDWSARQIVDQPGSIEDMALRVVETESSEWDYDAEDAAILVYQSKKKIAVAIAPTLFFGVDEVMGFGPFNLVAAGGTNEKWTGDHDSKFWRHRTAEYGSLAQNSRSQQTVSKGQLAIGLVKRIVRTSNTGATQPSSAERREPDKTERREEIEGDAEFLLPAPSPFQERERYYQIPYANTVQKLNARAEELGTLLIGRSLGASFTLPLASVEVTSPHARIDFTTPDGSVQSFLVDNLTYAIDATSAVVSGDGIYLGTVPATETPDRIQRPYRETQRLKGQMRAMGQMTDNQPDLLDQLIQGQARAQGQLMSKREMFLQGQARAQGQTLTNDPDHIRGQMRAMGQMISYPDQMQGQARAQGRLLGLVNYVEAQGQARTQGQVEEGYLFQQELQGQMRAQGKVEEGSLIGEELQGQMRAQGQIYGAALPYDALQGQARAQGQIEYLTNDFFADYEARVLAAGDNIREGRVDEVQALITALEPYAAGILMLLTFTDRRNGLGTDTNNPSIVPIINREGYTCQGFNLTEANRVTAGLELTGTEYVQTGILTRDININAFTIDFQGIQTAVANSNAYMLSVETVATASRHAFYRATTSTTTGAFGYTVAASTGQVASTPTGGTGVTSNYLFTGKTGGAFTQVSYYRDGSFVADTTYTSEYSDDFAASTNTTSKLTIGARCNSIGAITNFARMTAQALLVMDVNVSASDAAAIRTAINTFVAGTAV